jgi:hypothetical protein
MNEMKNEAAAAAWVALATVCAVPMVAALVRLIVEGLGS